jgi:large subunit ribosomal protein L24
MAHAPKANRAKAPARPRKHHISKGDRVRVIRGNNRDMEGTVLRVLRTQDKVVVEGVNMRKRHTRPSQANPDGGIISFEGPIHISNVMLVDPSSGNASRVRARIEEDGTTERIAVKSGNPIPRPK